MVVDDDPVITSIVQVLLEKDGWKVVVFNESPAAMENLDGVAPDCVIVDIMMPYMDGLEFCEKVRAHGSYRDLPIIIHSGKSYEFDRSRAYEVGASGFISKPVQPESFANEVREIVEDNIELTFWGVRGTLPVPGAASVRYGGNTSCVSMNFSRDRRFIFDAGTGIKVLSDHLLQAQGGKCSATLFISHSHWDHINALPFFIPLYISGNALEICGPAQGKLSVQDVVSAQMSDVYFPITTKEFAANVSYRDLRQDRYTIDGIEVLTMMLNHPGYCLGYRINYNGRSVCYVTDNELFPSGHDQHDAGYLRHLVDFIRDADALITDCTYFEGEYQAKAGWGHSNINEVARLAHVAEVKRLFLFHHDPDHTDDDIDRKLAVANDILASLDSSTACVAPVEKQTYQV